MLANAVYARKGQDVLQTATDEEVAAIVRGRVPKTWLEGKLKLK